MRDRRRYEWGVNTREVRSKRKQSVDYTHKERGLYSNGVSIGLVKGTNKPH